MRWLIPIVGHLAILALLMVVMKNDQWIRENMYDYRALLPYSLVVLDGVWAAISVNRKSFRSLGIAAALWLTCTIVVLSSFMSVHSVPTGMRDRSEGGEVFIVIASFGAMILILAGFGLGRLLQYLAA